MTTNQKHIAGMSRARADALGYVYDTDLNLIAFALDLGAAAFHGANVRAGWWSDPATGAPVERNVFELLALVHSEVSEATEAQRKGLMDDKLPARPGVAVELADAIIRILDIAGALNVPIGTILLEKARFNMTREDHRLENRRLPGGKVA